MAPSPRSIQCLLGLQSYDIVFGVLCAFVFQCDNICLSYPLDDDFSQRPSNVIFEKICIEDPEDDSAPNGGLGPVSSEWKSAM